MHKLPGGLQMCHKNFFTGLVGGLVDNNPQNGASCSVSHSITMALTEKALDSTRCPLDREVYK